MASFTTIPKLDDTTSEIGSSISSKGRRRRRRNNNKQLAGSKPSTLSSPPVVPRLAETKPVRLQLGLNLDVELELKARLQGDITLTLLLNEIDPTDAGNEGPLAHRAEKKETPRESEELRINTQGVAADSAELFYLRLGRLRLRQRWIDREVSASLTATVALGIAAGGFAVGFLTSRCLDSIAAGYVAM